ncbi:hypothetical protein I7I53_03502 [Histoplasma capsulatum var. duboisii H88]|uniref:Uncharacterized protein n=1 Tax=Ajellomyces capsulatus (strain H88) TaxID=544711 RepID=A0A8A1LT42_AJEC8|nr:hypothetical protein I7I53_03502 [Histoplasma capsulatum var. duboisii H88]
MNRESSLSLSLTKSFRHGNSDSQSSHYSLTMNDHMLGQKQMHSLQEPSLLKSCHLDSVPFLCVYRELSSLAHPHALREASGARALPASPPGR